MQTNEKKTKVMVFRNGGRLRANEKWYLNGRRLDTVNKYKYLGVVFTPRLKWTLTQKTIFTHATKAVFFIRQTVTKM